LQSSFCVVLLYPKTAADAINEVAMMPMIILFMIQNFYVFENRF